MQQHTLQIIEILNQQRKKIPYRLKSLDSELRNNSLQDDSKRRLSTLELPTQSMLYLELDINVQRGKREIKKVLNKEIITTNRKQINSNSMKKKSCQQSTLLPKIDLISFQNNPFPILFPKKDQMMKLRKINSRKYYVY